MTKREACVEMFDLFLEANDALARGDADAPSYAILAAHLGAAARERLRAIEMMKAAVAAGRN